MNLDAGVIDLASIWPSERLQTCCDLEGSSPHRRVERLESLLISMLDERFSVSAAIERSLHLLEAAHGNLRVRDVAQTVGISERTLQRQLSNLVGLTPKQLARTLRIRHAVQALQQTPSANWAELALNCGFYDQAHLINEMTTLTRHTPSEFVKLDKSRGYFLSERKLDGFFQDEHP